MFDDAAESRHTAEEIDEEIVGSTGHEKSCEKEVEVEAVARDGRLQTTTRHKMQQLACQTGHRGK